MESGEKRKDVVSIWSRQVGESSWPQVTLLSNVLRARDGVADGLPTHSSPRDPATAILNSKTLSATNSPVRRAEPARRAGEPPRPRLIFRVSKDRDREQYCWYLMLQPYTPASPDSRIFYLAGGRLHFCRLFTSHASYFGSYSLFLISFIFFLVAIYRVFKNKRVL